MQLAFSAKLSVELRRKPWSRGSLPGSMSCLDGCPAYDDGYSPDGSLAVVCRLIMVDARLCGKSGRIARSAMLFVPFGSRPPNAPLAQDTVSSYPAQLSYSILAVPRLPPLRRGCAGPHGLLFGALKAFLKRSAFFGQDARVQVRAAVASEQHGSTAIPQSHHASPWMRSYLTSVSHRLILTTQDA